jgi:hypothetical protein
MYAFAHTFSTRICVQFVLLNQVLIFYFILFFIYIIIYYFFIYFIIFLIILILIDIYAMQQQAPPPDRDAQLVSLALKTLGSFDFSKHNLLEFVRECVVTYLDDDNPYLQRERGSGRVENGRGRGERGEVERAGLKDLGVS